MCNMPYENDLINLNILIEFLQPTTSDRLWKRLASDYVTSNVAHVVFMGLYFSRLVLVFLTLQALRRSF